MNAIVAVYNRERTGTYVFVFDTFVFTRLESDGFESDVITRLLAKVPSDVNLLEQEQLLFPVHLPSKDGDNFGHWYLIQSHRKLGHIAAVDFIRMGAHPKAIGLVQQFLEGLHRRAHAGKPQSALTLGWRSASLSPPRTPQQPNGFDCGVCLCVAMWCCIRKVPLSKALTAELLVTTASHRSFWRSLLTVWLMNDSTRRVRDQDSDRSAQGSSSTQGSSSSDLSHDLLADALSMLWAASSYVTLRDLVEELEAQGAGTFTSSAVLAAIEDAGFAVSHDGWIE